MKLRDYQEDAVAQATEHLAARPVLMAPTGAGKTVMAGELARRTRDSGRTLFIAPRRDLVFQAHESFSRAGLHSGVWLGDRRPDAHDDVVCTTIQTLERRRSGDKNLPQAGLLIFDECHTHLDQQAAVFRTGYEGKPAMIGLSATPFRMDGRGLGELYGHLIRRISYGELIDQGHLVDTKVYIGQKFDRDDIKKRVKVDRMTGDFRKKALQDYMEKDESGVICDTVAEWQRHTPGRRTVAFCAGVPHSQQVARMFTQAGIPAAHIDGSAPSWKREEMYGMLRRGELLVLCCADLLTYGWDLPACEVCIFLRPTASRVLFCQAVGRVCRPHEGKEHAIVLDEVGNHIEFGYLRDLDHLDVSLDDGVEGGAEEGPRVIRCQKCYALSPAGSDECWSCGESLDQERSASDETQERVFDDLPPVNATLVEFSRDKTGLAEEEAFLAEVLESQARMFAPPGRAVGYFNDRFKRMPWDPSPTSGHRVDWAGSIQRWWGSVMDPRRLPRDLRAMLADPDGGALTCATDSDIDLLRRWGITAQKKPGAVKLTAFGRRAVAELAQEVAR